MPLVILLLIVLFMLMGVLIGVSNGFFQNMGANIGKNHLHDLGFDDNDINQQDDEDATLYAFRQKQNRQKKDDE